MDRYCRFICALLLFSVCGCSRAEGPATPAASAQAPSTPAPTALDEYVAREEPNYKWQKEGEQAAEQGRVTTLKLVSQTWQGKEWTHRVEIVRPAKVEFPDTALVLISFGTSPNNPVSQLLARQIGAAVISVSEVPSQPLFNRREDALIAYSFQKYLETGDKTWPLLLPMTKAVIKAIDAAEEHSRQEDDKPLTKFIVAGVSKRGWTSWLVAAADSRVHPGRIAGIIPLVYNNLNIPKQMPHQLESWGKYSEMIGDYTALGLQDQIGASRGKELIALVDPYFYRDRLTMPKLLINGSNDRYWTPDATRFYLNDLPGSTSMYIAPNAGHNLGSDLTNVLSTMAAWFRLVVAKQPVPTLSTKPAVWNDKRTVLSGPKFFIDSHGVQIKYKTRLWEAYSDTRDLRSAKWRSSDLDEGQQKFDLSMSYSVGLGAPGSKMYNCMAYFTEMEVLKSDEPTLRLSSPITIYEGGKLDKPTHQ